MIVYLKISYPYYTGKIREAKKYYLAWESALADI